MVDNIYGALAQSGLGNVEVEGVNPSLKFVDRLTRNQEHQEKTHCHFFGILYAKPPIGDLRFQPPQPLSQPSTQRMDASQPPSRSLQMQDIFNIEGSEDSLCLNVYVPQSLRGSDKGIRLESSNEGQCVTSVSDSSKMTGELNQKTKPLLQKGVDSEIDDMKILKRIKLPNEISKPLAVLEYFHGGGLSRGSGNYHEITPDSLKNQGNVISVTVNYRLGVLGFLNLRSSTCKGNAGLKDQVMALEWIKENIGGFGGLFHKAIVQSGGIYTPWGFTGHHTEKVKKIKDKFEDLQSIPAVQLAVQFALIESENRSKAIVQSGGLYSAWGFEGNNVQNLEEIGCGILDEPADQVFNKFERYVIDKSECLRSFTIDTSMIISRKELLEKNSNEVIQKRHENLNHLKYIFRPTKGNYPINHLVKRLCSWVFPNLLTLQVSSGYDENILKLNQCWLKSAAPKLEKIFKEWIGRMMKLTRITVQIYTDMYSGLLNFEEFVQICGKMPHLESIIWAGQGECHYHSDYKHPKEEIIKFI